MNHQEKQSIFDEYARTRDFENWNDLKNCCIEYDIDLDEYIFDVCDLIQEEQQKRIAGNAKIDGSEYSRCGCVINENSIINPENLIK